MGNIMDESYQQMGFEDAKEAHTLIASVDMRTPEGLLSFNNWKECDGTKEGLLEVIERLAMLRASDYRAGGRDTMATLDDAVTQLEALLAADGLLVDLGLTKYEGGVWFAGFSIGVDDEGDDVVFGGHGLTPAEAIANAIEVYKAEA